MKGEENVKGDEEDVAAPLARRLLWVDRPDGVERLVRALYVLCALLVVFELFWHRHAYVPGEELKGYHAIVGFFAFMWIVLGARGLRRLIRRDEDYYGATSVNSEAYPEAGLGRLDARDGDDAARLLRVRDGRLAGGEGAGGEGAGGERVGGEGAGSEGVGNEGAGGDGTGGGAASAGTAGDDVPSDDVTGDGDGGSGVGDARARKPGDAGSDA